MLLGRLVESSPARRRPTTSATNADSPALERRPRPQRARRSRFELHARRRARSVRSPTVIVALAVSVAVVLPLAFGDAVVEQRQAVELDLDARVLARRDAQQGVRARTCRPARGGSRVAVRCHRTGRSIERVAYAQPARRCVPRRLGDIGPGHVPPLRGDLRVRRREAEEAGRAVEQRAEDARRVGAGQAHPLDGAVGGDQAVGLAIRQERVLGDRGKVIHGPRTSGGAQLPQRDREGCDVEHAVTAEVVEQREDAADRRAVACSPRVERARGRAPRRRSRGAAPPRLRASALRASASQRSARGSSTMRSTSQSSRRRSPTSSIRRGDRLDLDVVRGGELGDVERAREQVERGDRRRERRAARPARRTPRRRRSMLGRHRGHRGQPRDRNREERDGRRDGQRSRAVAEQPARRRARRAAGSRGTSAVCASTSTRRVERLDVAPQRVLVEDRARGFVGAHDVGRRSRRSPRRGGTRTSCRPGSPRRSRARSR